MWLCTQLRLHLFCLHFLQNVIFTRVLYLFFSVLFSSFFYLSSANVIHINPKMLYTLQVRCFMSMTSEQLA